MGDGVVTKKDTYPKFPRGEKIPSGDFVLHFSKNVRTNLCFFQKTSLLFHRNMIEYVGKTFLCQKKTGGYSTYGNSEKKTVHGR